MLVSGLLVVIFLVLYVGVQRLSISYDWLLEYLPLFKWSFIGAVALCVLIPILKTIVKRK